MKGIVVDHAMIVWFEPKVQNAACCTNGRNRTSPMLFYRFRGLDLRDAICGPTDFKYFTMSPFP